MAEKLAQYGLYPWLRKGLVNHISKDGDASGKRASVNASIKINSSIVGKDFPILGPSDIVGFDQRLVIRTEPQPNHTTFAPNHLAFIEFYEEDLPWRYTPLKNPKDKDSLRPWIFLIVLKDDEFNELGPGAHFPLIEVFNLNAVLDTFREEQALYWAHVQRTDQDSNQHHPDRVISRIICPRKLDPNTPYTGFLLPAFDTGIQAGGGTTVGERPATIYPVYYQWRFHTSNAVDFEYLVNLLEPRTMPYEIGRRFVDFSQPGFIDIDLKNIDSLKELMIEGPLVASKDAAPSPDAVTQEEAFVKELERLATRTSIKVNHQQDPEVTIPFYGAKHVINDTLDAELGTNYEKSKVKWLHELNWKNPGNRASAGIGTKIIRLQQDDYMARAWDQLESIVAANKSLNLAEVMIRLSERWQEQYLNPLGASIQYGQIMHPMLRRQTEYREVFSADPCLAPAVLSTAFRRQTSPGTVLGRNIARFGERNANAMLQSVLNGRTAHPFLHKLGDERSETSYIFNGYPGNEYPAYDPADDLADDKFIDALIPGRTTEQNCKPESIDALLTPIDFKERYRALLDKMYEGLKDYMDENSIRLKPAMAYPHFDDPMFVKLRELGTDYLIANLDKVPNNTISVLESNQVFIEAFMVGLNYELGREMRWREYPTDERGSYFRQFWDTAGLANYDESGANAAAESELYKDISEIHTWEGIAGGNSLGDHRPPPPDAQPEGDTGNKTSGTGNNMVLVIRGDLIRAFPNVTVYAVKAEEITEREGVRIGWTDANGRMTEKTIKMKEEAIKYPIFIAEVQPDVKFLGFSLTESEIKGTGKGSDLGYFFVLKEVPGELRLGLDIAPEQTTEKDNNYKWQWEDLSWPEMILDKGFINVGNNPFAGKQMSVGEETWGKNSAHMAAIFYQKPVMAVIHGSEMLSFKE